MQGKGARKICKIFIYENRRCSESNAYNIIFVPYIFALFTYGNIKIRKEFIFKSY